jgi:hypothetical protein
MTRFSGQIALLVCLLATVPLRATIIRVPADQPTIQAAINSASNGDTVVVYPGTYYENVIFRGKKIVLTSRFYETSDLDFIQSTIINGSKAIHTDTASCVLFINGEDSTAVLQGFTITAGQGTKWEDEHGAGIYREGGGILSANSAPTIRYNLIINNEATNISGVVSSGGGGIRAGDGNPKILNNVVIANKGRYGAGIVLNYTGAIVRNNIITNNSGGQDYGGGALWMNANGACGKFIENNTIAGNKVFGVYVYQGSSVIRNSIIWGNASAQISARAGGPAVTYSDVQGGQTGTGNLNVNPQLADSNYCLETNSPCVDTGDSSTIYDDLPDPSSPANAIPPSKGSLRNDMGAYGGPGAGALPIFSAITGIVSTGQRPPSGFRLEQNYPNPFNPSTVINYRLSESDQVSLKIFDVLGSERRTLFNQRQMAGDHSVIFNASGFPSGVYFYRLQVGTRVETRRLMILK